MRDRRPQDWVTDLAGRHHLEDAMAKALAAHPGLTLVRRATNALDALDFAALGPGERLAQVELKAKHQPYQGWGRLRPELAERDVFILDELALRRIVQTGRYAYLVVADRPTGRWCVWSTVDLVLASKVRTVRTLATTTTSIKGKVLLDLREAATAVESASSAAGVIVEALAQSDQCWDAIGPWPTGPTIQVRPRRTS